VQADRGVAVGGDQPISGALVTGEHPGWVIVAQTGASVNVYTEGLQHAKAEVQHPFDEGKRLQEAEKHEAAITQFEKAFAASENDSQRYVLHLRIGNSFLYLGRLPEAEGHYRQAVVAAERAGENAGRALALANLGAVLFHRGFPEHGLRCYQESLRIFIDLGDEVQQARQIGDIASLQLARGQLDEAEEGYRRALRVLEAKNLPKRQLTQVLNLATVCELRDRLGEAEQLTLRGLDIARETAFRRGEAHALAKLASVRERKGQPRVAERTYQEALAIFQALASPLDEAHILTSLGSLAEERGHRRKARKLFEQALALFAAAGAGGPWPWTAEQALHRLAPTRAPRSTPKRPREKGPPKP
jgi:tetratricopeptide (TPR) repeat protein